MTLLAYLLISLGIAVQLGAVTFASVKNKDLNLWALFSGIGVLCLGLILITLQATA